MMANSHDGLKDFFKRFEFDFHERNGNQFIYETVPFENVNLNVILG